jgi:hypothetical protein
MFDQAETAFRILGLDFQKTFDYCFHWGLVLKTRRMFLMGFIVKHPEQGRVFLVEWLKLNPPATLRDACQAIRAEFHRDAPDKIAFGRGLKNPEEKGLRFYDPYYIESVCDRVSLSS